MATETADSGSAEVTDGGAADTDSGAAHRRSLVVTTIATLGGLLAGVISSMVASGATPALQATDTVGFLVLAGVVGVEYALMYLAGVDVTDFSTKDNLYVVFMTFSLWFVSWTILLTTA